MRFRSLLLAAALALPAMQLAVAAPRDFRTLPNVPQPVPTDTTAVGVEGASISGTYIKIAVDMATALNGPDLRVVPIVGQGSLQNIDDILHLRGIDVAIVQADAVPYLQSTRVLPPGANTSFQYITKLYDEEVHVIAGPQYKTIDDLKGKTINADVPRSGSSMTAHLLFDAMNIPVTYTNDSQEVAAGKLARGEIAAMVRVAGKPVSLFTGLPGNAGLHLLPLPQDERFLKTYAPGQFVHADYPSLVPDGQAIDTLAVGSILAVYGWAPGTPRFKSVSRLVTSLFAHFDALQQPPYHPKWKEVNLAASVPGWTRFPAATEEVDRVLNSPARAEFARFVAAGPATASLTPEQRAALFDQFVRWRRGEPK